jgi:hypothetical protein
MTDDEAKQVLEKIKVGREPIEIDKIEAAMCHALTALADRKALVEAYGECPDCDRLDWLDPHIDAARRHTKGE